MANKFHIRMPKKMEASIEGQACRKILEKFPGVLIRKLNGSGYRNWPDRMFLFPNGQVLFIEFKRPGEKPRPGQEWMMTELQRRHHVALSADTVEEAVSLANAVGSLPEDL